MARGLSELQRAILGMALANRQAEGRDGKAHSGADVTHAEVLASVYGWTPDKSDLRYSDSYSVKEHAGKRRYGGHKFRKSVFCPGEYNAARASVSRAFKRLEERGLLDRVNGVFAWWAGGNLTQPGADVATLQGDGDE